MAYSHSRFRKTLAVVRIVTGVVFVSVGAFKVSSLEFAHNVFPRFLEEGIQGAAVDWVRPVLVWVVSYGAGRVGVMIGFVELFIGISMLLGLAVRPAALLGMVYAVCLVLATWNQASTVPSMLQSTTHQLRNLFPFLVFLLLGVGHAGETWGLGSLYHGHRARKWEADNLLREEEQALASEEKESGSFEEFLEREERELERQRHELGRDGAVMSEEEEERSEL